MLHNRLLKIIGLSLIVLSMLGLGNVSAQVNDLPNGNHHNEISYRVSSQAGAPEITVRKLSFTSTEILDGGSFTFPATRLIDLPILQQFDICNIGSSDLLISNVNSLVSGQNFSQTLGPTDPPTSDVVLPGACTRFAVEFNATATGPYAGAISIQSNDADENPYDIALAAEAVPDSAPEISVQVNEFDRAFLLLDGMTYPDDGCFGCFTGFDRSVDQPPVTHHFDICNQGTGDTLIIDNPATLVSGAGFQQIGAPNATLPPSTCSGFDVEFNATTPGDYTGAITIQNNDPGENPFDIFLRATASDPAPTPTPQPADTVSIARAEYVSNKTELRVEATSTDANASLQVFVTSSNELIGTLNNQGGGKYKGQFNWPVNPQNITINSSSGGSDSANVPLK